MELHGSISPGESYHAPLRRVFRITQRYYTSLESETVLRYSVKAINDSVRPEGLFNSMLVYGTFPTFLLGMKDLPGRTELIAAMRSAREKFVRITAELCINTALK